METACQPPTPVETECQQSRHGDATFSNTELTMEYVKEFRYAARVADELLRLHKPAVLIVSNSVCNSRTWHRFRVHSDKNRSADAHHVRLITTVNGAEELHVTSFTWVLGFVFTMWHKSGGPNSLKVAA